MDQVCSQLFLSPGARERDDNLVFVRQRLLRSDSDVAALLTQYQAVRRGRGIPDNERDPLVSVLKLSGLVTGNAGFLQVRNRIYQTAFDETWIRNNMPEAETRRQRKAFHRGVLITVASVLALAALLLALLVNSLRLNPLGLKATLPDGTVLTLDAVGYGRQHHYEPGRFRSAWMPLSSNPDRQTRRKPSFDLETTGDALTFWITRQDTNSGSYLNFDWWSHFELIDSHGCAFFGNLRAIRHDRDTSGSYDAVQLTPLAPTDASFVVASGAAHTFPRREKNIRLRLYNLNQQAVAEFNLPNPVHRTYPVWRPEPLPQTRRDRDLAVTLTEVGTSIVDYRWHHAVIPLPVTRLAWQAFWNETLSSGWQPAAIALYDATGNSQSILPPRPEPGLCPHEAAWSAKTLLYPTAAAAAEKPANIWNLNDQQLPAHATIDPKRESRPLDGLKVEFRAAAGPGRFRLDQGHLVPQPSSSADQTLIGDGWFIHSRSESPFPSLNPVLIAAGRPFLVFHIDNQNAPPAEIGFTALDDQQQPIAPEIHRQGDLYFLAFPTQILTLREARLWVRRPRQLEFLFRPPSRSDQPNHSS